MIKRYQGKRFLAFLISTAALTVGAFNIDPASFPVFASTIGVLFSAFVAGQTTTDFNEVRHGVENG